MRAATARRRAPPHSAFHPAAAPAAQTRLELTPGYARRVRQAVEVCDAFLGELLASSMEGAWPGHGVLQARRAAPASSAARHRPTRTTRRALTAAPLAH